MTLLKKTIFRTAAFSFLLSGFGAFNETSAVAPGMSKSSYAAQVFKAPGRLVKKGLTKIVNRRKADQATAQAKQEQRK